MKYPDFLNELMEQTLADFPEVPTRTLAKRIYNDNKKFFKDVEQVRSALRRRRGNAGMSSMKTEYIRENGEAGWVPQLPPSLAVDWTPFHVEAGSRLAIISDIHIPYHSVKHLNMWYRLAQDYEPTHILINGDLLDFYRMSRYEKDPNMRDTLYEVDQTLQFFEWLTSSFEADIIFKEGNHDERWRKYIYNQAPEFSKFKQFELREVLCLDEFNITYVTDQRIVMAGSFPILHGHEVHGSGGVNPARSLASKLEDSALMGHCHRTSEHLSRNTFGKWVRCYSTGCLCELHPEFSRINKWNNGCAFVDTYDDDSYEVNNVVLE